MSTNSAATSAVNPPGHDQPTKMPEPRPGDNERMVMDWLNWKAAVTGKPKPDGLTARQYARALYENTVEPKPKRDDDPAGEHDWYARLSKGQRIILGKAHEAKLRDPKERAKRKAALATDAAYQRRLINDQIEYRLKIQAKEGRDVRPYIKGKSAAEERQDRKERNDKLRAMTFNALANGINPYPLVEYADENVCHKTARARARHLVCEELLNVGSLDPKCPELLARFERFAEVEAEAAERLIAGVVETLRVAKAIRKANGKVYLRREISSEDSARLTDAG